MTVLRATLPRVALEPLRGVAEAEEAAIRTLFHEHEHRDYQLQLLGVPKSAMVDFLWDGLRGTTDHVYLARESRGGTSCADGLLALTPHRWLSEKLGCRTWGISHLVVARGAPPGTAAAMLRAGVAELDGAADFVYGRVASSDIAAIEGLQASGFQTVGGELCGVFDDLTQVSPPGEPPPGVRFGALGAGPDVENVEEVVEEIAAIARRAHDVNHFAYDRRFPRDRVRALYEGLVRFDAAAANGGVTVAERDGAVAGFLTYKWNRRLEAYAGRRLGSLNYIGVDPDARLRGLGDQLNRHAIAALRREGAVAATVRTMISNYRALSILRKLGVRIASANLVFHRWLAGRGGAPPLRRVD